MGKFIVVKRKIISVYLILFLYISTLSIGISSPLNNTENYKGDNFDEKESWVVIICGGDDGNPRDITAGPELLRASSQRVYNTYKSLGYDDEHIYYLLDRDISAEGVDGLVSKSNMQGSITTWLASKVDYNDDCSIIYIGHGWLGNKRFDYKPHLIIWNNLTRSLEYVFDDELSQWVDEISYSNCTIIIDACFSGCFIDKLSKENRIIITGTSSKAAGFGPNELIFSYHFFNKLVTSVSYGQAWEYADKQLFKRNILDELRISVSLFELLINKIGMFVQNPQIDDNGDKISHGTILPNKLPIRNDGLLALKVYP